MSKKKKQEFKESSIEDYYDLKVDKVDELVAALKEGSTASDKSDKEINYSINENTGVYDEKNVKRNGEDKQFDPYKIDKVSGIPTWLKAVFIKWWFSGVVCFLIMWGLPLDNGLDGVILSGVVLGVFVDLFVNPLFRYMESDRKEYNAYMMFPFPFKAYWTFLTNIIYYLGLMFLVSLTYTGINALITLISGAKATGFYVEPLLFGVICVAEDMAFIGIKDGIVALVRRKKIKDKEKESDD